MLTAVVIAFPQLSPIVDRWRERTCADRTSIGIQPHVTLLFPFVPAEHIDGSVIDDLRRTIAAAPTFDVDFRETRRFPETLYLAPEPVEPFVRLTQSIVERWPEHPPYEGAFDEIVPHLAVAHGAKAVLDEAETDVKAKLPVGAAVGEALLLEEIEPDWVRWGTRARFPLGR